MSLDVLMQVVLSAMIAILSSFLAAHLSVKKFYTEKWWERKEKAYTEIINALYDMVGFFEVFKDDYGQNDFISTQNSQELHIRHSEGYKVVRRATDLAALYVSKDAVKVLKKLSKREVLVYGSEPLWDVYDLEYQNHLKALEDFIRIAVLDLKGKRKPIFILF